MKLYLTDNTENAVLYRHLIRIKSECERFKWLKGLSQIPKNVTKSADTVQDYCEEQLQQIIKSSTLFYKMSADEENAFFEMCEQSTVLKKYVGSCCILATNEIQMVMEEFKRLHINSCVGDALSTQKNVLIY